MRAIPPQVLDFLESHHGIVSTDQLAGLGCRPTDVRALVRTGLLEQVLQGAYRARGQPLSRHGRLLAVCVAHPNGVVGGPSAGSWWGFRRLPPVARVVEDGDLIDPVYVIVPPHSNPTVRRWVTPYRTAAIHPDVDIVELPDGLRVTSRARTVLDLARFVDDVDLLSMIEQAMSDGSVSLGEMYAVASDWLSPRRGWVTRFLRTLDRVLDGGAAESHHETVLGDALRAAGLTGLVRQLDVDLPGYGAARFDVAVPRLAWAIEVDVFPTHAETAGAERDRQRDRASVAAGWTVTRVGPEGFGAALPSTVERLLGVARDLDRDARRCSGESLV